MTRTLSTRIAKLEAAGRRNRPAIVDGPYSAEQARKDMGELTGNGSGDAFRRLWTAISDGFFETPEGKMSFAEPQERSDKNECC